MFPVRVLLHQSRQGFWGERLQVSAVLQPGSEEEKMKINVITLLVGGLLLGGAAFILVEGASILYQMMW